MNIDKKQAIGLVKAIAAFGLTIGSTAISIATDGGASAGTIAATGTGIAALLTAAPPWAKSLIDTLGSIGLNITSNILERLFDSMRDKVVVDSSKLNHDIAKALIAACKAAAVESRDYWHNHFEELVAKTGDNREDAAKIWKKLETLPKHLDQVVSQDDLTSEALPDNDMLNLTRHSKQADAQAILRNIVSQRLKTYLDNTPHTEAVNAIADHLTHAWLAQFQDELRDIAEDGQRAKIAFEHLWQDSISSALSGIISSQHQIQYDTTMLRGDTAMLLAGHDMQLKEIFAIQRAIGNIPQEVTGQVTQAIQSFKVYFDQLLTDKYPHAAALERDLRDFLRRTEPGLSADATHKLVHSLLACDALARVFHKEWTGFTQATTEELIFYVRHAETSPDVVENLDTTVQDILGLKIPLARIVELRSPLLRGVAQMDLEDIKEVYYKHRPSPTCRFPEECINRETILSRILYQLARFADTPNLLLDFVHLLEQKMSRLTTKEEKQALFEWLNTTAQCLGLRDGFIKQPADNSASDTPAPVHLLVKLEDHNPMYNTYLIKAWCFQGAEQTLLHEDNLRATLEELPAVLGQFLANVEKDAIVETIEFLVPRDLLGESFESYERLYPEDLSETRTPSVCSIGFHYHVVVRIRGKKRYAKLVKFRDKLASLEQNDTDLPILTIETLDDKEDIFRDLCDELEDAQPLCLALIPPLATDVYYNDVADALVEVGTPIALWRRQDRDNEGFTELLSCNLGDLRTHVQKKRKKARPSNPNDLGNHLTLLWDDPNRVPLDDSESKRLGAPAQS